MTNSNAPELRSKNLPAAAPNGGKLILTAAVVATVSAFALYLLTNYLILAGVLGTIGLGLFATQQIVKKSLALTASQQAQSLDSPLLRLDDVRKQVSKCKFLENVEAEGTLAAAQADQLVQQYQNLNDLLLQKFEPGELTLSRYQEGIFVLCMAIAENLMNVRTSLENLNLTKPDGIVFDTHPWLAQRLQVKTVLQNNAQALTELSALFAQLNQITTKEAYRNGLEQALQQIRNLSERASKYTKT
jgi:hypothetical protein